MLLVEIEIVFVGVVEVRRFWIVESVVLVVVLMVIVLDVFRRLVVFISKDVDVVLMLLFVELIVFEMVSVLFVES